LVAGSELWIGQWHCPGERRTWRKEHASHTVIELFREGGHLRQLAGDQIVVGPTSVVVHPADDEFRMASPSNRPQRSTIIYLRGELERGVRGATTGRLDASTALRHRELIASRDPVAIEEAALDLVRDVLAIPAAPRRGRPPASWRRVADDMLHAIATRHHERLSLDDIAAAAGSSPFHASRVFRAVTGETVHRHLVRVRLRVALYALARDEGRDLGELAFAAGFSSHSHFSSAFRVEFGVSPSAVRGRSAKPLC
jgi:AraC-like DNA-binding protein